MTASAPNEFIPQANPGAGYLAQKEGIEAAIRRTLESGWYILGKEVEAFEREFAATAGARFAVGVASGTDAIEVALRAAGIGGGDAVFTVSHTAVATVAAIERAGAAPVLVDVVPRSFTMAPAHLDRSLNAIASGRVSAPGRPKAIIPVHLYGHPADMAAILEIAARHGLVVIEDCAQAHGARIGSQTCGTFGAMGAFSFYPTKNLGALGDGGLVVANDEGLRSRLVALRQYGWVERYVSSMPGVNSRLDELQAAILRVKLPRLEAGNQRRAQIAKAYSEAIAAGGGLVAPEAAPGVTHVYHQYVIRTKRRDALIQRLKELSIGCAIHYPLPVHLQKAYLNKIAVGEGGLPATEAACREILSLPMYPEMTDAQVERVAQGLASWRE